MAKYRAVHRLNRARVHTGISSRTANTDVARTVLACNASPTGKVLTCGLYQGAAGRVEVRASYPCENLIRSELVSSLDAARTIAGRRDRFATVSWCRIAMISRCSEARERTMNRSEWSSETTTDDTTAGYRRMPGTSVDEPRTEILVPAGAWAHSRNSSDSSRRSCRKRLE